MKKLKLLSLVLVFFIFKINAQNTITIQGKVIDHKTGEPLIGVNIFNQNLNQGTFTELDGSFKIKIGALPNTLIFSYIGYENLLFEIKENPRNPLKIKLKETSLTLPQIEITEKPIIEKLTKKTYTTKDFLIDGEFILILTYEGLNSGNELLLTNHRGFVFDQLKLDFKENIHYLYRGCLGNIHVVGNWNVFEVSTAGNKIQLVSKNPRKDFEKLIVPCVEASKDFVYMKSSEMLNQYIRYDFISKKLQSRVTSIHVSDMENIYRMYEEIGIIKKAQEGSSASSGAVPPISGGKSAMRPEEADGWVAIFYKPLFSPLKKVNKQLYLFNHTMGFLEKYSFEGEQKNILPITYHKDKKWLPRIMVDKKHNKVYTAFETPKGRVIHRIHLEDGSVRPVLWLDTKFVGKMEIYDGYLFYLESGILPTERNRILQKVKLEE